MTVNNLSGAIKLTEASDDDRSNFKNQRKLNFNRGPALGPTKKQRSSNSRFI